MTGFLLGLVRFLIGRAIKAAAGITLALMCGYGIGTLVLQAMRGM